MDILFRSLSRHKFSTGALHGDMSQSVRFATLEKFRTGELQLLVCSDVAARGLDIGGLSHVFNFDVPRHAEDYVHRIGRTGRAGMEGHAFTIAQPDDKSAVDAIGKLIGHVIPRIVIEGLDPVDWAESEGGRRRKRGRKGKEARPPEKVEKKARGKAKVAQKPGREAKAHDKGWRKPDQERARGENGREANAVVGFGRDVPAFMTVRSRRRTGRQVV